MRRGIREASTPRERLARIFESADRIQDPRYSQEEVLLVLRAIVNGIRELEIILERPGSASTESFMAKAAKAGFKILVASAVDAGLSAAGEAAGQFWRATKKAPKAGAKKAAKRTGAKKAVSVRRIAS